MGMKELFYLTENEEDPEIEGFIDPSGIRQTSKKKKSEFNQHIIVRNSEKNKNSKEKAAKT